MCTGKVEILVCPTCKEHIDTLFSVDACPPIKSGALGCTTTLSTPPIKPKEVSAAADCYSCRLDAPRRAEEKKKAAAEAAKAAKALEESVLAKVNGGDADLELHSAQYW